MCCFDDGSDAGDADDVCAMKASLPCVPEDDGNVDTTPSVDDAMMLLLRMTSFRCALMPEDERWRW